MTKRWWCGWIGLGVAFLAFGCGAKDDMTGDPAEPIAGRTVDSPGSSGQGGASGSQSLAGTGAGAGGSSGAAGMTPPAQQAGSGGAPMPAGSTAAGTGGAAAGSGAAGSDAPMEMACETEEEEKFSFFMVSYEAIIRESGSADGFGGNFGGIEGADDLCLKVALTSSECAGNKTWRAFLSTTMEDAIDRIGEGPWHDRLGRVLAVKKEDLLADRPTSADPEIINDFPNEFGVPNHNPDGTGEVDNHQTLTGSGIDGKLYTQAPGMSGGMGGGPFGGPTTCKDGEWSPEKATCWDWTVDAPMGCPRVGHSWPRQGSGINWISVWNESGCAPGVVLDDFTQPEGFGVGSFGGYGGFYCFALTP